jgi:hypothetical protein
VGAGTDVVLPVDSYKEAALLLRRPFTPEAIKFKPQSVTKSGKTMCVYYIDMRLVVERLNLVVPHLWADSYEPLGQRHMICRLTVDGITRSDVGEGAGKALYSDALKRAAVKFGVGVSLYAIPKVFLDGEVKFLNDEGDSNVKYLRDQYRRWLEAFGIDRFGAPFDHGDVEGAAGDIEVDEDAPTPMANPSQPLDPVLDVLAPLEFIATAIRAKNKRALSDKMWENFKREAQESEDGFKNVGEALAVIYSDLGGDVEALRQEFKRLKAAA